MFYLEVEDGVMDLLVVEDDPNDVVLYQAALRRIAPGCRFQFLRDGREAVDYLSALLRQEASAPVPAVILTDLKMPRLNGHELIGWVRSQEALARTPVILLSSTEMPKDIETALRLGANGCFQKPQGREELRAIFETVLRRWGRSG